MLYYLIVEKFKHDTGSCTQIVLQQIKGIVLQPQQCLPGVRQGDPCLPVTEQHLQVWLGVSPDCGAHF